MGPTDPGLDRTLARVYKHMGPTDPADSADSADFRSTGIASVNVVPCPIELSPHTRPPLPTMMPRAIARPIPVPGAPVPAAEHLPQTLPHIPPISSCPMP